MALDSSSSICVVDDDPAVLHSLCFLLECEGHQVEPFASGEALLATFPRPCPRCVILDYVMPGMNGLEVFRRLQAFDIRTPAILITGHPDPRIRTWAREAGLSLVEKPLAFDTFLVTLEHGAALSSRA